MFKPDGYNLLAEKLPEGSTELVLEWLKLYPVKVVITRPRHSKLGDFRPAQKGKAARVSVNAGLHPVEFIITLAHELAHAENYNLHGRSVKPHGPEWKAAFRGMLKQIVSAGFLDDRFSKAIHDCFFKRERLATSSCSILRRLYDDENGIGFVIRVDDIPEGSVFKTTSGKLMIKGEKIRTRYKCREVRTKRIYTVHPMAEIVDFQAPEL